jgi:hypothetical protein
MGADEFTDLIGVLVAMLLVTVIGVPLFVALGYFLNPNWYWAAGVCAIPGLVIAYNRFRPRPVDPVPPPDEIPPER